MNTKQILGDGAVQTSIVGAGVLAAGTYLIGPSWPVGVIWLVWLVLTVVAVRGAVDTQ